MRPLRSFPVTFLLPAQSRCTHRSAIGVFPSHSCSPPNPAAYTDQPNELTPLQARSPALRSPCSTLWQPSSPLRAPLAALSGNHRPLYFHSPSPPSSKTPDHSLSTAVRSPQPRPNFQLSSGTNIATPFSLCPRPASSLMRVARPAPPHFSNTRTEHLFIRPARPRLDISPSS